MAVLYDPKWEKENDVPAISPARLALLKAAALIEKNGLAKYTQLDEDGSMCIHGAISIATEGRPFGGGAVYCEAVSLIVGHLQSLGSLHQRAGGAAPWNNQPERTKDEVVAALRGAAFAAH